MQIILKMTLKKHFIGSPIFDKKISGIQFKESVIIGAEFWNTNKVSCNMRNMKYFL